MASDSEKNFDVEKRQGSLFDASVRNTLLVNESIKMAQSSMLALGLAELAFLGVMFFEYDYFDGGIKALIVTLIASFLLFLFGQIRQYKAQLRRARDYEKKASRATEYLNAGNQYLNHEPEDIATPKQQIKSDNISNLLIFLSFVLILSVTVVTLVLVVAA